MLFPCFLAVILSLVFCYLTILLCRKFNWYDEVDPRKIHTGQIPRLGGVGLFASFIISLLVYIIFYIRRPVSFVQPLYIAALLILVCGILDDFFNLRAKLKFLVQIIVALIVCCSSNTFTMLFPFQIPLLLGRVITFIWVLGIINAFNLIDGMDWLCGGISFLILLTLGVLTFYENSAISVVYFILCGSLIGFLFWNKPDAKIFLGDGGSQTLGYIVSVSPFLNAHSHTFVYNQTLIMLLFCSIPILDVIAAVWRRRREHRAIFSPDRGHIHHKLLNIGFTKKTAIAFLLCLQALICMAVLVSVFMSPHSGMILLLFALSFVSIIFITFHYLNRSVNRLKKGHLEDHPQKEH
ncbi:MAG: undecaprenyl/decaprenyl-phosphate alpha-N-acetylglucosaminyl 1-phosphate transferase [Treponema sp.]|nr:undecaprenyl/decaprenyl-phosphate alpha-N-acetylglucosaminyl 1-phosphate transferase [Treponema sp.]